MLYPYIAQGQHASRMFTMIQACIKAKVPVALVGNPGVGKTATIEALAKAENRELINLSLSTLPSEDVSGLPHATKINVGTEAEPRIVDAASYAIPVWQQRMLHNSHSILFLDEFSTASPSTQHAFLQLVQNRRLPGSDEPFSDDVAIILAMNPANQAGGSPIDLPIANRFAWFVFEPDFNDWANGFLSNWLVDKPLEPKTDVLTDSKQILENNAKIRKTIVNYLDSDRGAHAVTVVPTGSEVPPGDMVKRNDPAEMEVFSLTFPSARSWDNLARILALLPSDAMHYISMAINATIGSSQGLAFYQYYLSHYKGIDIKKVLAHPDKIDWKNMSIDDSSGVFDALLEEAKHGKADIVLRVYVTIWEAGAKNLLSGNRIQDIYNAEYITQLPKSKQEWFTNQYIATFGDFLKELNKQA